VARPLLPDGATVAREGDEARSLARRALIAGLVSLAACAGGAGQPATGGASGAGGAASTGAAGGAGAPATVASNLGSTPITVSKTADAASIVLVSSNLVPDPKSTIDYVDWFGEIRNTGAAPACLVKLDLDFHNGAGASVLKLEAYADADPYEMGAVDLVAGCIPPGHTAGVWSNNLASAPVQTSSIAEVNVGISLLAAPSAVPHPDAPPIAGGAIAPDAIGAGTWDVDGTLTAIKTIYDIGLTVYLRGANGLLVAHGEDVHPGTLFAGTPWRFSARGETMVASPPTGFLATDDFISGVKASFSNDVRLPAPLLPVRDEIAASRTLRENLRARAQVRALITRPLTLPAR
jgi:hypothetical protein